VRSLLAHYAMTRLPIEGTYFVKTWRSSEELAGGAPIGTAMLGLYVGDALVDPARSVGDEAASSGASDGDLDGDRDGRTVDATAPIDATGPINASRSTFHRLAQDECWHFYDGDPIRLVLLHPDGTSSDVTLGRDHRAGHHVQFVIPAGTWQAGEVAGGGRWALFGCSLAPGFVSESFEGGRRRELLARYPSRHADIVRLTDDDLDAWTPTTLPPGFET
jgi:predicted cupin superfamily sugar epimerase